MSNNIYLTKKCNLKCRYCFASEYTDKVQEEITIENFKKALSFIKRDSSHIGLIGGEPTLYSKLDEIIDILIKDEKINEVFFYTNGLNLNKYPKLQDNKFNILINCNSQEEIGKNNFECLIENLNHISKIKKGKISLGININEKITDYSYIFELLKIININVVRISYAVQNETKENTNDVMDSFFKIKPIIISFYEQCIEKNVIPNLDCNSLPYCILDSKDKKIIMKIYNLSKSNYSIGKANIFPNSCTPIIDIFPDLTVGRCFGLSKYIKVKMDDFANISQIENYFIKKIDKNVKSVFLTKNCKECKYKLIDKCNICLSYKIKNTLLLTE